MTPVSHIAFLLGLCLLLPFGCDASNWKEPHPHRGVVTPFQPGDPKVKLDNKASRILTSGKPFQTQIQDGSTGRGLVVQDVRSSTDVVWGRILDYNSYAKMVPKTVESKNYKVEKHRGGHETIYTRMKVGFPMIKLEFFVKHEYYPKLNSLTWTLDYTKHSDFDDSCGYWYVIPHPDNKDWTRVYYSVQVSMYAWVPKFVVDFMSTKALTDATGWVKKYSELEQDKINKKKGVATQKSQDDVVDSTQKKKRWGLIPIRPKQESLSDIGETSGSADVALQRREKVGLTRVALMTTVFVLILFNIHLYFSQ